MTDAPGPDQPRRAEIEDAVMDLRYVAEAIEDGKVQLLLDDYDERGFAVERLQNEVDVLKEYYEGQTTRLHTALRAMARRSTANRTRYLDVAEALGCGRGGTHQWICDLARMDSELHRAVTDVLMKPLEPVQWEGDAF